MIKKKSARFYKINKRDGKNNTWTYFVPGQNANSVRLEAEQDYVATEVTVDDWREVSVELDHDGVYFSAMIDGQEWTFRQGVEGYSYLTAYLGPEYDKANRIYLS